MVPSGPFPPIAGRIPARPENALRAVSRPARTFCVQAGLALHSAVPCRNLSNADSGPYLNEGRGSGPSGRAGNSEENP